MSNSRWCPICHLIKIIRREVKTCGSTTCVAAWRSFTPEQKAKAIEGAAELDELPSFYLDVDTKTGSIAKRPIPEIPSGSTQRDNEFLEKVFGPDAPGVVKEDATKIPVIFGHAVDCKCELCETVRKQIY